MFVNDFFMLFIKTFNQFIINRSALGRRPSTSISFREERRAGVSTCIILLIRFLSSLSAILLVFYNNSRKRRRKKEKTYFLIERHSPTWQQGEDQSKQKQFEKLSHLKINTPRNRRQVGHLFNSYLLTPQNKELKLPIF